VIDERGRTYVREIGSKDLESGELGETLRNIPKFLQEFFFFQIPNLSGRSS